MSEPSGGDRPAPTLSVPGLPESHRSTVPASASVAASPSDDMPKKVALPERFHEYRVVRRLGAGSMGEVYLARDTELDRDVAIKVMSTSSPAHYELMRVEAKAAAAIQDSNVVTIYRVGELEGRPYIVSEYIRGTSLDRIKKPMPWQRALDIGIGLARGLAAAHRHEVLHRDIKPANSILTEFGQAKLIDFGLAVRAGRDALGENAIVGTPAYMAPELWQGAPASRRTDIYAMGVLLYELCTGHVPRSAGTVHAISSLEDEVPGIDPRFAALVHRCLADEPAERWASGDELHEALAALHDARTPLPAGNPYRGLLPFEKTHRALFFGRSAEVWHVVEQMRAQEFVLLAGESGVGKSSLARAGVLPAIAEGALGDERTWAIYPLVPGRRPLTVLVHTLARVLGMDEDELVPDIEHGDLSALSRSLRKLHGERRGTLLFFDHLEELITLAEPDDAEHTSILLARLIEHTPGVRVLATARGDYLAPLAALPGLGQILERSLCIIRPLEAEAVREIIVAPARAKGVQFESEALVKRLSEAATGTRGALPLLQFALAQLWEQRNVQEGVITESALEAIGGVAGALARHATGVLDAQLPDTRRAMQHLLVRLVTSSGTRARLTAGELGLDRDEARRKAMDALVGGRLVVAGEHDGDPVYEIAHEALISGWPTLRAWLDRASNIRAVHERLSAAARAWEAAGRAGEYLWGPKQLATGEAMDPAALSATESAFLAASARSLRRGRWQRRLAVAAMLALLAGAYGIFLIDREREIQEQLSVAERGVSEAQGLWRALAARHAQTMQDLRADRREAAAIHWQEFLAQAPEVDTAYQEASIPLELALILDPGRARTRELMSTLLEGRARLAEILGIARERDQFVERLALYDRTAHTRWSAPVPVAVDTRPGARVTIERYEPEDGALIARPWDDGRIHTTPFRLELPPGSYLLTIHHDATHVEVRYPLLVRPDDMPGIELDIARPPRDAVPEGFGPPRDAVPEGFVYVPPGRYLLGFGRDADDEPLRNFFITDPLHEREGHAFLIARYETTYEEWMAFLDACWPAGCDGVVPTLLDVKRNDGSPVAVMLHRHPEHGWELVMRPTNSHTYSAVRDQPLVYQDRKVRRAQRWERFPVSGTSWEDVQGYLQWLRATGRRPGARLCTAEEWERAARGADARLFPHGNRLRPDEANFDLTYGQVPQSFGPDEVGAHPRSASPFGLQDMTGNVWELVEVRTQIPGSDIGQGNDSEAKKIRIRGGGFFALAETNAVVNNWDFTSDHRTSTVGFRICIDAPRL